jgi:hypothetical protein
VGVRLSGNSSSYEVMYTSDEQIRTLRLFGSSVGSWEEMIGSGLAATAGSGGPLMQSVGLLVLVWLRAVGSSDPVTGSCLGARTLV